MRNFTKPSLTLEQQITYLEGHGMIIDDPAQAMACLQHISYYRLSAYWLPFENGKNSTGIRFKPDTHFKTVIDLHNFDCKLRRLIMEAIECIEVAIRGNWAYQMAILGDGHAYLSKKHYRNNDKFQENKKRLQDEVKKSKETFIAHYKKTYSKPKLPPIWMVSEILSFGSLSHWYANLKEKSVRQAIANPFGLDEKVFKTYIHHLSVIRNICAHHGRLWNRIIPVPLLLPNKPDSLGTLINPDAPKRIYNTLVMLSYSLNKIKNTQDWGQRLEDHIETLPFGTVSQMGFPDGWKGTFA